ncbi:MAG: oxidoreductase [Rubrivivax sp.]|nr:oxidoreductase [Rubrivivax sp.]
MLDRTLTVRVARIRPQTADVSAFEFVHPWGGTLPGYRAGAHIDVHLPGGFTRQYSLAGAEPHAAGDHHATAGAKPSPTGAAPGCTHYVIGVKRDEASRGGSASLHERVRAGDLLAISTPRNTFPLHAEAKHHLLLAGGIGLTPLLAMAEQLQREGASFTLCVFARSRAQLAFADELAALAPQVRLHFDEPREGVGAHQLDIPALLRHHPPGTHLYLCGPGGFMQAVLAAAAHWPEDSVHLEYFAPPTPDGGAGRDEPFTLVIAGRNIEVPVAADQSAVDALHDLGIDVPTSCSQGVCGTCAVPLMGGHPDHRDHCLSATERRGRIALCCSRALAGGRIVVEIG